MGFSKVPWGSEGGRVPVVVWGRKNDGFCGLVDFVFLKNWVVIYPFREENGEGFVVYSFSNLSLIIGGNQFFHGYCGIFSLSFTLLCFYFVINFFQISFNSRDFWRRAFWFPPLPLSRFLLRFWEGFL